MPRGPVPLPALARTRTPRRTAAWAAIFGAAAVGGALLLGSLVGGFLAYVRTDSAGARLAARRVLRFSFGACILAFLYVTARLLADLQSLDVKRRWI